MSADKAQVYLRKEAAAQRQLDAAIRMTLHDEDELAIHSVVAAAYGVLRGLKKKHGRRELADRLGIFIFAVASDLASGKIDKLPSIFADTQFANIIPDISAGIKRGEIKSEKEVSQRLVLINETSHWNKFNDSANFLKHADRDPDRILALDNVDNDPLFTSAITAYIELLGTPTWEMICYCVCRGFEIENFSPKLKAIAKEPLEKRRRACLSLLRELKMRGAVALA